MSATPLADVVAASDAVAAAAARSVKIATLAGLLARLEPDEVEPVVGFLAGEARQGRIGVGWATLAGVDAAPVAIPTLTVGDLDRAVDAIMAARGPRSVAVRAGLLADLLGAATPPEASFIRRLFGGELRQGALEGIMAEAVAKAAGVAAAAVRRACMLSGNLGRTATVALTDGLEGLASTRLEVLRPVQPMLASTSEGVAEALGDLGLSSVEWKLDGIRIQVHRRGDDIRVFTRNLNDITGRVPEVVAVTAGLAMESAVLDGEALILSEAERPGAFQHTMSRVGRQALRPVPSPDGDDIPPETSGAGLVPRFFDLLHLDGRDLLDVPLTERLDELERAAGPWRLPGRLTDDPAEGAAVLAEALSAGHEGVVVKGAASLYEAGRRGGAWRKVKVAATFDLVVLAVEWGSGRRQGWLSNIHLGARQPDTGELVMVGKTFKGMTDETLRWQTQRFLELEIRRAGHTVYLRPEVVAEIALDGVQSSSRYPGGVALRFARLRRYRDDKGPADADSIDAVRALGGLPPLTSG